MVTLVNHYVLIILMKYSIIMYRNDNKLYNSQIKMNLKSTFEVLLYIYRHGHTHARAHTHTQTHTYV